MINFSEILGARNSRDGRSGIGQVYNILVHPHLFACGVVWCGVVWCGVVRCGVVWCGVVWCGAVWCGVFNLTFKI